ncbi:MAG: DUF2298 domain-containing protein [Archaeoglobaceae archaeon]|nr:DUF2298 domain-containing protein [Archaeoglobaceae archaeon]MCX8151672.1 DUF2298 domain-containing protein [Archaeoglobaceae archaeon]MDW8013050.1 DUF2298 domain-containing protein [Archaeoglobaceae archaeon]
MIEAAVFYATSLLITQIFRKYFSYAIARAFSLLFLSLSTYTLSIFIPFKISFYISFAVILSLSIYYYIKLYYFNILEKSEIVFAAVYTFFLTLRYMDPTIFDSEKFMDMAIVNSILKAKSMHPNDPFLAGFKLDCYYYFGHVIAAVIVLLSFSPPEVGYNIAVAAIPAYSALLFFELSKSIRFLTLALFSGNLYSVVDFFNRFVNSKPIDILYYWNSTRVIEGTINEFPYFSFIHADLHAHVIAIFLKILLFSLILRKNYFPTTLTLFAIFATNSWDYPLAFLLVLLISFTEKDKKLLYYSFFSFLLVIPFYLSMNFPAAKIFLSTEKTDPVQFLMYAFFPISLCYLLLRQKIVIVTSIPAFIISPILAIVSPLLTSALINLKKDSREAFLIASVVSFALPEFLAIESRMNTVFKFYLFAWISAYLYISLKFNSNKKWKNIIVNILLILSLIYPIAATPVRYHGFENTLDGMYFLKYYGEYEAVKWLQGKDGIIIEEGCSKILCGYSYAGRVAAFTGNPAVVAWTNHEFSWRRNLEVLIERSKDVESFYRAENCEDMYKIIEKYNIKYIFVGVEEIKTFDVDPKKFENCFEVVFKHGNAVIFTKNRSA